jgi:hypothetical protein
LAGLPDAVTVSGGLTLGGTSSGTSALNLTLSGVADLAPDVYTIRINATDDDGASTDNEDVQITVLREDATITYTGVFTASTTTPSSNDSQVLLSAAIQDLADPETGDVTNARVRFINRDNNTFISPELTPVLVMPRFELTILPAGTWDWLIPRVV